MQEKLNQIASLGNNHLVHTSVGCYSFQTVGASTINMAQPSVLPMYNSSYRAIPLKVGEFNIVPAGDTNYFPLELREILDEANLMPGVLAKQLGLLWGQGPTLYKEVFEDRKKIRDWQHDPEVQAWLDDWENLDYLMQVIINFKHSNYYFSKSIRNKGARIGQTPRINELKCIGNDIARLEWPDETGTNNRIIVGDWVQPWKYGLKAYPVWDKKRPFNNPISMTYEQLYSYALPNSYPRSDFHGSLNWIRLSSSLAKLLIAFNTNSAAIKYHIEVPAAYWEARIEELTNKYPDEEITYTHQLFLDLKEKTFLKVAEVLSGIENVGKFLATDCLFDAQGGQYVGWKVLPLDQKVKDYIDAQINISKQAGYEISSGAGLDPSLGNITSDGNLTGGSEKLYAFKLYLKTSNDIPEYIICKHLNQTIKANFPNKNLKIGFYHENILTEEMTAPKDRTKNN